MELGVRIGNIDARGVAHLGQRAMDEPLAAGAELWVGAMEAHARVVGAFQRCAAGDDPRPRARRASGGATVEVGPGTVHVLLALPHPAALMPCDPSRILNRYVRPLLRALTVSTGVKASYFGRDWVSLRGRPVAWVGFAHDGTTGRTIVEAFCAVATPFATGEGARRATFLGKEPSTLAEIAGRDVALDRVARSVVDAYAIAYGAPTVALPAPLARATARDGDALDDPPWRGVAASDIGEVGAGPDARGVLRVGGDFLASRDALARLERWLATSPSLGDDAAVDAAVADTLGAPGVALEGLRTLAPVGDAVRRALREVEPP